MQYASTLYDIMCMEVHKRCKNNRCYWVALTINFVEFHGKTFPFPEVAGPHPLLQQLVARVQGPAHQHPIPVLHCKENPIYVLPEKKLRGLSPNFHIHVSVSDLYIPTLQLKSNLCIPFWEMRDLSPNFHHSYVCERFIYSQDQSTFFPAVE